MSLNRDSRYHLPEGTVYGVLLNFVREREVWREPAANAPYGGMPHAPVLYIKTANTFNGHGGAVALPHGVDALEVGATVGVIMGQSGDPERVALFLDWSIPHAQFYRPAVKYKNLDGFLGVGAQSLPWQGPETLAGLGVDVLINQTRVQHVAWSGLHLKMPDLLETLCGFTEFRAGDVLMLGLDCLADGTRPLARAGDRVTLKTAHSLVLEQTVLGVSE